MVLLEDEEDAEVRWAKHYSSLHDILLVGEGDFSFSLSLANAFGSASNIVATSLDSYAVVVSNYGNAKSNIENLNKMGATILHGVDASRMKLQPDLSRRKFHRIVFNFPHAGFIGKEDKIRVIKNASHMLWPFGEVHITHKTAAPFCHWNLEELALKHSLLLVEKVDFHITDYPGYDNKRGNGNRCDQPFPLGESCTFKFCVGDVSKRKDATSSFENPGVQSFKVFESKAISSGITNGNNYFISQCRNQSTLMRSLDSRCWAQYMVPTNTRLLPCDSFLNPHVSAKSMPLLPCDSFLNPHVSARSIPGHFGSPSAPAAPLLRLDVPRYLRNILATISLPSTTLPSSYFANPYVFSNGLSPPLNHCTGRYFSMDYDYPAEQDHRGAPFGCNAQFVEPNEVAVVRRAQMRRMLFKAHESRPCPPSDSPWPY